MQPKPPNKIDERAAEYSPQKEGGQNLGGNNSALNENKTLLTIERVLEFGFVIGMASLATVLYQHGYPKWSDLCSYFSLGAIPCFLYINAEDEWPHKTLFRILCVVTFFLISALFMCLNSGEFMAVISPNAKLTIAMVLTVLTLVAWVWAFCPVSESGLITKSSPQISGNPSTQPDNPEKKSDSPIWGEWKIEKSGLVVHVGNNPATIMPDENGDLKETAVWPLCNPCPIVMSAKNWHLSFVLWVCDNVNRIEVKDWTIPPLPSGWQSNHDDDTMEIINDKGVAVLQMVINNPSDMSVRGMFSVDGKSFLTADFTSAANVFRPISMPLLFKYPAWRFPATRTDAPLNTFGRIPDPLLSPEEDKKWALQREIWWQNFLAAQKKWDASTPQQRQEWLTSGQPTPTDIMKAGPGVPTTEPNK